MLLSLALTLVGSHATAETPPYDLAADLQQRKDEARKLFGKGTGTETAQGVFLLVAPAAARPSLSGATDLARRALDAYFNGRFTVRPLHAVSVFLFPSAAPYHAHCKEHTGAPCISPYGFYSPGERTIIMNIGPGPGTLTHELVHPIVEDDFPSAPTWLNEGIASLFEAPWMPRAGEIHGTKNWRLPRLLRGLAAKDERPSAVPKSLFGLSDEAFRDGHEDLHYAVARYFCQWLDSKGWLWPFYRKWRQEFASDPTGEKAFADVTGHSPAEIEAAWIAWVRKL